MARLTLLVILVVWMSWSKKAFGPSDPTALSPATCLAIFAAGWMTLIFGLRAWSLAAARRAIHGSSAGLFRVQRAMHFARLFIPLWLGVGIYVLKWGELIEWACRRLYAWPSVDAHVELPQALLGTAPALLTWMALWWSHFPAERAHREQSIFANLDDDLPIHAPPTFRQTFGANLRLQILFTLVPVLGLLLFHDLLTVALALCHVQHGQYIDGLVTIPATLAMFVLAPEILRRTLETERLADSPLRRKLERMCADVGLRYRDILLWRTGDTMGNAAVMGVLPGVRYVLLSDLLLETMTDEQIEAVFAHELGHVVHKHLMWFGLYAIITLLFMTGPAATLVEQIKALYVHRFSQASWDDIEGVVASAIGFGAFILAFGYLSPKFERQADVFAARTIERKRRAEAADGAPLPTPSDSHVGERGAALFVSALQRVANINHIPIDARNWSHGSIQTRMRALLEMSGDPQHTRRFDRFMNRLYAGLLVLLCGFGAWAGVEAARPEAALPAGSTPTARNAQAMPPAPAAGLAR